MIDAERMEVTFSFEPHPYQWGGIAFLSDHHRAALFDEPGLGKSMQSLLSMRDRVPLGSGQILVVATGDAWGVWQDEARLWLDEEPGMFVGAKPDESNLDQSIVVTSYARLAGVLPARPWAGVIFDESQMLRNRNTRTLFKTVRSFFDAKGPLRRVPVYLLSGSPIVKNTGDVWPLLHLIDKQRWSSYWNFVKKYCITWEDHFGWHVEGITNAKVLRAELREVALWRLKSEVQPDLPPIVRQRIPLKMTPKQAKAYRELEREMYTKADFSTRIADAGGLVLAPTVLARETRLRQLLACPRVLGIDDDGAALTAIRQHAEASSRPFVVFSPFVEALRYAQSTLASTGRPTYLTHGGLGQRFKVPVDLFKKAAAAGEAPILLCSTFMGKSWSVSRVTYECKHLGWDWTDTTMFQAESRLGREGQTDTVLSHYYVHEGTHDMDALEILAGKRRLADVILARKKRWQT